MSKLQIQFSTSTAFTSGIIRRLTHSPFSHVDIVLPEGLLGVSGKDDSITDPGGVRIRPHKAWPYLTEPKTANIQCDDAIAIAVINAARSQIGKPFDNGALWCMLQDQAKTPVTTQRDWRNTASWFCSELVIWSLEQGGLFKYPLAVCKNRITPADVLLLINPFMSVEDIISFIK